MSSVSIGQAGEQAAADALAAKGFNIQVRNWRTKWCEVDIIAQLEETLWFIEVKYRATTSFGDGLEYVGPSKLQHMQRAAELWTTMHHWDGEYTLGAIPVTGKGTVGELVEI